MTGQHEESVWPLFRFDVVFEEILGTFYDFVYHCSTVTFIRYNVFIKYCLSVRQLTRDVPADACFYM